MFNHFTLNHFTLKFTQEGKGSRKAKQFWERIKWKESFYPIIKLTIQHSNQECGTGEEIEKDPWNRKESHKTNPSEYTQLIFDKGQTVTQQWKDNLFYKWSWHNWISMGKKINNNYTLT